MKNRLVLVMVSFLLGVLSTVIVEWGVEQRQIHRYQEMAAILPMTNTEYRESWNRHLALPKNVSSKQIAALFLMVRLSQLEKEASTNANLMLGEFFFRRDPALAEEFLAMHLDDQPNDTESRDLLSRIKEREK